MTHTNIQVYEYLQPHYKWNLISMAFCDRMLIIMISYGCRETDVYYRLKSRGGDFVNPMIFDKENGDARVEMTNRFLGRQVQ